MKRFAHRIKGNKASQLPHSCIWFDTETKPVDLGENETGQRLWFGWACHQYTKGAGDWQTPLWLRFIEPLTFLEWIESRTRDKTRTYVFAHNLHFETAVLNIFKHLPTLGWEITRVITESPPFILAFRKGKKTIEFLDTGNWWLHSLAKIGKSIGIDKLGFPTDNDSIEIWDTYCKRDVEIIRLACHYWFEFIKRYDLGGFARTLAGQSYKAYRHRFMEHEIFIDDNERATGLGREAYHGGRTEAFFIGRLNEPVYCFDVNSMYPFVMASNDYPTKKVTYGRTPTLKELSQWLDDFCLVADVEIEPSEPRYAVIHNNKIVFPLGRFRTVLTTPDIVTALENDDIRETFAYAAYEKAPIFKRYVLEIYRLRLDAKKADDEVMTYNLKILMNSLYGKFGQTGRVWETVRRTDDLDVKVWDEFDLETKTLYSWRQFGGVVQCKAKDIESYESFPAIAAHVTAYARDLLWSYFQKAGRENVFYCDTDSLFVNEMGKRRLTSVCDETALGKLKLDKSFTWLSIHGLKDYDSDKGIVCKGVKAKAKWIDKDTVEQEEWKKVPTYDKGTVTPSGWVEPLSLTPLDWS
jgi:hypothetical protein